ncbi:MAG: class I SAM-dependent RNA methyltransferase [Gemmatimonadaceae bacterium]
MPLRQNDSERLDIFAQAAPGLEPIVARELKALGMKPHKEIGGAGFRAEMRGVYAANLWLRSASRVIVRLGDFHASSFHELERHAKRLPWSRFLPLTGAVRVRVTCRKSQLYHSDAVAERILSAISRVAPQGLELHHDAGAEEAVETESVGETRQRDTQLFIVRISNDRCEISADSSGDLLHRRGYKKEVGKAPLRETLAAAMVLASAWKSDEPLLDPMCGSGTIPIEAALIGRGIAPGLQRRFQFMNWPGFEVERWNSLLESARGSAKSFTGLIRGADRDNGVVAAAQRNASRAGVGDCIEFVAAPLSASLASRNGEPGGWVITNPPYGVRVGEAGALRDLYAALGAGVATKGGWRMGVLVADQALERQGRLPLRTRFTTKNGGIPVRYLISEPSHAEPGKLTPVPAKVP